MDFNYRTNSTKTISMKELTAEELTNMDESEYYLHMNSGHGERAVMDKKKVVIYGDLRAKEAVEKFARECYEVMKVQSMTVNIVPAFEKYCKQLGVEL